MEYPHESLAMPMPRYTHTALAYPGFQIRLLTLTPAKRTEPLSGTLQTVDINEPGEFRALSYTWGAIAKSCSLHLDDCILPIGSNLQTALLEIRTRYKKAILWIDSVCIDQNNAEELTEQIAITTHIYMRSSTTVAWLGTGYGRQTDRALLRFLRFLASYRSVEKLAEMHLQSENLGDCVDVLELCFLAFKTSDSYKKLDVAPSAEVSLMTTLLDFCNNPYFLRRWVVQEIGVARHIILLLGAETISSRNMANASRLLNVEGSPIRELEGYNGIMLLLLQKRIHSVLEGMERFRQFGCRDDRDRVAALLWLLPSYHPHADVQSYRVDYSRSINDNYQDFALMLFQAQQDGLQSISWNGQQVFCAAARRHYVGASTNPDLPTWVPDWRVEPSRSTIDLMMFRNSDAVIHGEQVVLTYIQNQSMPGVHWKWAVLKDGAQRRLQFEVPEALSYDMAVTADHHNTIQPGDCIVDLRDCLSKAENATKSTGWSLHLLCFTA